MRKSERMVCPSEKIRELVCQGEKSERLVCPSEKFREIGLP